MEPYHKTGPNSREKTGKLSPFEEGKLFIVENYLEAVGMMTPAYDLLGQAAIKSGVSAGAVRRPLGETKVIQVQIKESTVMKKSDLLLESYIKGMKFSV